MRAVVQRVASARVGVGGATVGVIDRGLVVLLVVSARDTDTDADWMADRITTLRIFPDEEGKMNRSLVEAHGEVLVVSQFTLYGDARKGRRPSFARAAQGERAEMMYSRVVERIRDRGIACATGEFGAMMQVELVNDGPVTLLLDSEKTF